jgi:hypothetical protein
LFWHVAIIQGYSLYKQSKSEGKHMNISNVEEAFESNQYLFLILKNYSFGKLEIEMAAFTLIKDSYQKEKKKTLH